MKYVAVEIFSKFSYSFPEVELNWHSEVLRLLKILTPKNQSFPKLNTVSYKISVEGVLLCFVLVGGGRR